MLRLLKLQPKALINPSSRALPCFSSSSSSPPPPPDLDSASTGDPPRDRAATGDSTPPPPPPPSYSSYFSDIKERLKYPSPPRRIPTDPPPPSVFSAAAKPAPAHSLEEIRKHLAEFKLKSDGPTSGGRPSSNSAPPYPDLFNSNVFGRPGPRADTVGPDSDRRISLDSIMESLKKLRPSSGGDSRFNISGFQDGLRQQGSREGGRNQLFGTDKLPDSIFGKEKREKKAEGGPEPKIRSTEFVKMYGYEELGQKLQRLRPEKDGKNEECFSLSELNERLAKLRELEETEMDSKMDALPLRELRNSLERIKAVEDAKKSKRNMLSLLHFGDLKTPTFMLSPPQEQLLENYFHPDHMSSSEKLNMELKKVRDEFKISENDCGSARVQVAQLTTKIKHLSSTLHKKDKHSRKGLHEMIQLRKKHLKYLRRTDWDSYCFVISKLGLRDVPGYKIANYKT
ncbi:hypothetical protein KSP39_PZI017250 [Platanthera zijinensis]|uniref:Small ribosomal subunit protein uS15c n=1 Tax=Platanthera zijinensis TaxID=2320716 RepID=A0AAP0B6N5_9ASPA